jgi:hypothetical protein
MVRRGPSALLLLSTPSGASDTASAPIHCVQASDNHYAAKLSSFHTASQDNK